jgi:hypothetical protein
MALGPPPRAAGSFFVRAPGVRARIVSLSGEAAAMDYEARHALGIHVLRKSVILWVGTGILLAMCGVALYSRDESLVYVVLALTACFSIYGIFFGIWAARRLSKET